MSMQYLLLEKERNFINELRQKASMNDSALSLDDEAIQREVMDAIERVNHRQQSHEFEPEFSKNVSTSVFLKSTVEKLSNSRRSKSMARGAIAHGLHTDLDSKKTVKQRLMKELGYLITPQRSNVGRPVRSMARSTIMG